MCQRLRKGPVSQGFFLPSPPCLLLSFIHCAELYSEGFRMCQSPTIPGQLSVDSCKCLTPVLHQIPITVKWQTTASEPTQPSQRLTIGLRAHPPASDVPRVPRVCVLCLPLVNMKYCAHYQSLFSDLRQVQLKAEMRAPLEMFARGALITSRVNPSQTFFL